MARWNNNDDYTVSLLFSACDLGDINLVKQIITQQGIDINVKGRKGDTCLGTACRGKQAEVVKFLISQGADINIREKDGATPLLIACKMQSYEIVEILIKNGANMYYEGQWRDTPFIIACQRNCQEIMRLFISKGIDINRQNLAGETALHRATKYSRRDTITILLQNGADPNIKDNYHLTPLLLACERNDPLLIDEFISKGGDIFIKDGRGFNCLMTACANGNHDTVKLLLSKGADLKDKTTLGSDLLQLACEGGHTKTAKVLLEMGLNIDGKGINGGNALIKACANNKEKTAEFLIQNGIDINASDQNGVTALHVACSNRLLNIIQMLIDKSANLNQADSRGYTALHYTCDKRPRQKNNGDDVCQQIGLLLAKGADINFQNKAGKTPLHILTENFDIDDEVESRKTPPQIISEQRLKNAILAMAKYSVNLNIKDDQGNTAAHLARNREIFELLVLLGADISIENNKSQTPLDIFAYDSDIPKFFRNRGECLLYACKKSLKEVVQILLMQGISVNYRNEDGQTALHVVREVETANVLLEKAVLVNVQDYEGKTPLHIAARNGRYDIVELLVVNGAIINIIDNNEKTALDYEKEYRRYRENYYDSPFLTLQGARLGEEIKKDVTFIKELIANYEQSLIAAIDNNQFAYVESLLTPGSDLYRSRKKLVADLSRQNIQEILVEYQIHNILPTKQNSIYKVYVTEIIETLTPYAKDYKIQDYSRVYTVEISGNEYTLSDMEKWSNPGLSK